jgi:multidrug efflux pump subunit AcrA (membrane-fusion protein)
MKRSSIFLALALSAMIAPLAVRAQPASVDVRARLTTYVESTRVRPGDAVKKGDLLCQLDGRAYQAMLELTKAKLAAAEAVASQADAQVRRGDKLLQLKAISTEEHRKLTVDRIKALAGLEEAKADCKITEIQLAMTQVRAPFDGIVDKLLVNTGQLVKANDTIVVTVRKAAQEKTPDEIRQLMKQRHALLVKIADNMAIRYKDGAVTSKSVMLARKAASEAELELCDTPAERVKVLRNLVDLATELQKVADLHFQAGKITQVEALEAQAAVLEARIRLLREEAKSEPRPK